MKSRAFVWLLLLPFASLCHAQSEPAAPATPQIFPSERPGNSPVVDQPLKGPSESEKQRMLDNCKRAYDQLQGEVGSKGYAARDSYNQYYYDNYARDLAAIRLNAFWWQALASQVLLCVVVVVCLSGVFFSGYQLWIATSRGPVDGSAKSTADPISTSVELSWQSVRVTSSVIGLIVLVVSVAFLYLFLKEVYKIETAGELIGTPLIKEGSATKEPPATQ